MPDPVVQTVSYYEGVLDVYYALMTTVDTASTAAVYGTPKILGKSINVTATPKYAEGSLYASNVAVRKVKKLAGYDVNINADQLLATVRRDVLGRQTDTNGVELLSGSTVAPYVALAFAITKDNGSKELWWLYKCQGAEMDVSAKTRSDTIEYQTPTIKFSCERRANDDMLGVVVDSDDPGIGTGVVSGWFSSVYGATTGGSSGSGGASGD